MTTATLNLTLTGVTPAQYEAITTLLAGEGTTRTRKTRKQPEPTIIEDDEDEELKATSDDEDESNDGDDEDETTDESDDAPSVTFAEVKAALNKYGEKHPDQARAILAGFNIKNPKELASTKNQKYWEPVYRKVMAKIKTMKKAR